MGKRNLTRSMDELFPQPDPSQCRVCNDPVVDGRWSYCSERCRDIANTVQKMFIWDTVREKVLERDDYTCQECGLTKEMWTRAYWQTHELAKDRSETSNEFWEIWDSYNVTQTSSFEVDHINRIADGGHQFDERNLQTLCEPCHQDKTTEENTGSRSQRPAVTLEDYVES